MAAGQRDHTMAGEVRETGTPAREGGEGAPSPSVVHAGVPTRLETVGRSGPLHTAAQRGTAQEAQKLVVEGFDVMMRGAGGNTPLHLAALHDNLDVLEVLLHCGARCEVVNSMGNMPLHWAAHAGSVRCVEALLRVSGMHKLMAVNSKGETARALAVKRGHEEVAAMLGEWEEEYRSEVLHRSEGKVGGRYVPAHDPDLGPPVAGVFSPGTEERVSSDGENGGALEEGDGEERHGKEVVLAVLPQQAGAGWRLDGGWDEGRMVVVPDGDSKQDEDGFSTVALSQATMRAINAEIELDKIRQQNEELRRQTYQARFETQTNNKLLKELKGQVQILSSTVGESIGRIAEADERARQSAAEIDRLVEMHKGSAAQNALVIEQNELLRSRNEKMNSKNERVHQGVLELHNALFGPAFKPFKDSELDGVLVKCVEAVRTLIETEERRNIEIRDLQAQLAGIELTRYGVNPDVRVSNPAMVAAFASLRGASGLKHRAKQHKILDSLEAGALPNSVANPLRAARGQVDAVPAHLVTDGTVRGTPDEVA